MDRVILKTDVLVRITASDTVTGKEYDKYKAAGKVRSEDDIRKDIIETIKTEMGADTVEIVEMKTTITDEREGDAENG